MVRSKITGLLKKTAQITGYSEEQVAHVIKHVIDTLHYFLHNPYKAGLRLPYIGVLRVTSRFLRWYLLKYGMERLRNGKLTKERFRKYWELRKLTRDDEKRRKHGERFGTTNNPRWRPSADSTEGDTGSHDD